MLGGVPNVGHLKDCLNYDSERSIITKVLDFIPEGERIVREEFPDILIQFFRYIKRQRNILSTLDFDIIGTIDLLIKEYGIDVNYSLTDNGIVFDAIREAVILHEKRPQFLELLPGFNPVFNVNCLGLGQGISCLPQILKHLPDSKTIVKQKFPDILIQCLRYMKLSNVWDPNLFSLLLNEYGIDVNYTSTENVSVLHWLALFIASDFDEEERVDI